MINGKIATKEEILDAISKNNYNHITATYYLLAERKLRKEREHANRGGRPSSQLEMGPLSHVGRIHDYLICMRVGRGGDREGPPKL